ncbi:MAG: hypothetical protein DLM72_11195 [Candidatus Nitrosopolaris wilkensis]|nr:MAG: hypothetical protein DLM72_11195 [Candidatus Nitrosopolaris wilkensis]
MTLANTIMRILHVWYAVGAYVLTKYQRLLGYDSKVLIANVNDKYGIRKFYRDYSLNVKPEEFIETYLVEAEAANVIHISLIGIVLRTCLKSRRLKKIIIYYDGLFLG